MNAYASPSEDDYMNCFPFCLQNISVSCLSTFLRFLMDDTFKYAEDIEKEFGVMPLTVIPEGKIEGLDSAEDKVSRRSRYYNKNKKRKSKGKSK